MATGDGPQAPAQLGIVGGPRPAGLALGRSVLAGQLTGPALGDPEAFLQAGNGPAAALRGQ
jgi:hypothetical protein